MKAGSVSTGVFSGFAGFEIPASANPGWDIGGNTGAIVPFQFGKTAAGEFFCLRPWTNERVIVGSADDFHTISAVGAPRSNRYE